MYAGGGGVGGVGGGFNGGLIIGIILGGVVSVALVATIFKFRFSSTCRRVRSAPPCA